MPRPAARRTGSGYRKLALAGKLGDGRFALVSERDYDRLSAFRWCLAKNGYAYRWIPERKRPHSMQNDILHAPDGHIVDHINGNKLDNRRANLRVITKAQNRINHGPHRGSTSRYVGVSLCKKTRKWRADAQLGGRQVCLGYFESEEEAARVRDAFVRKHYGGLGRLNFPEEAGRHAS